MTTMKIPDDVKIPNDEKDVRVSFIIKDKDGQQKELSFRIGEVSNRIVIDENIPLKIFMYRAIGNNDTLINRFREIFRK